MTDVPLNRQPEEADGGFFLISHRGGGEFGPENTLEALEGAIRAGVVNIETDIHQTRDGVLVISHENRLNLHTIQKSDFAWVREHHPGIPTLEELLETAGSRCRFNLEIKQADADVILGALDGRDRGRFIISSFNEDIIRDIRELDQDISLGLLTFNDSFHRDRVVRFHREVGIQAVHPFYALSDEKFIETAHECGLIVVPWTVNGETHLERMLELGVDGVFTDSYSEFRAFLEGSGRAIRGYPA